jgi:hypothetical protein
MKWLVLVLVAACGGSSGDDGMSLGTIDARCKTLCASNEPTCGSDVTTCEQECQVRVQDMKPLCGTCLLENANGGECTTGQICCPRPEFPNSALDCGSACAGSVGVNPSPHPICNQICANSDASCGSAVQSCLDTCDARVAGVSGLCALCLLEGANGGVCAGGGGGGQPCCPSPEFPTSVNACASVCGN